MTEAFSHFMRREIFEQPRALRDTVQPRIASSGDRVVFPGLAIADLRLRQVRRIRIVGSGTSRHAGLAGKYMIEELARLPVEVDHASEFAYRDPVVSAEELLIAVTQSGETADTLAALRQAKSRGALSAAVCNVVESTIAREADAALYTYAGPEVSIASTKAFTAQLAVLFLLALYLGQLREQIRAELAAIYLKALLDLEKKLVRVLECEDEARSIAQEYSASTDYLFVGRGIHFAAALDGALKLKEVSYVHAEAYPAGEVKHGPNALVDEHLPVVILASRDEHNPGSLLRYDKVLSNIQDIGTRTRRLVVVGNTLEECATSRAAHSIAIPDAPELLLPILEIVPLQLVAYHTAVALGLDVDRPRNLRKAVLEE